MRPLPRQDRGAPPSLLEALVRRLRDLALGPEAEGSLKRTLEEILEETEVGEHRRLSEEERELVQKALSLGELEVADIMVPRSDIKAVPVEADLEQVVATMRAARHSRLLVYRGTLDDVVGVVHLKDLLDYWGNGGDFALERIVRPVPVVPPSMRALELVLELRKSRQRMAVVVDEFGGTDGLVTLEDVASELLGEIAEERVERGPPQLVERPDGTLEVDGRLDLETLEERLGIRLLAEDERDEADTVAGLIFALVDRVPRRGERVVHPSGVVFEVSDADPRRIKRVCVRPPSAGEGARAEIARPAA
ncbi:MAG: hemolysin family protein [Geminicoccaceae bacterium]|nr:hemolysin family protein [Geminicoccaceae bacterium]MCS7268795.1 hemolysin family protein [Geminicoccaceae bacterium]MCX7630878.1 hemolysin family protein [Geminicoccaceae bacterium]MDW8125872.1 hemolysin family protein [Geminicoccaceae bacterium]MDW8340505.1 hemolysin family protein [Geminicoccaceae bacterium]